MRCNFNDIVDYIPISDYGLFEPMGLELIGLFQYETARFENHEHVAVWLPDEVCEHILDKLKEIDSKYSMPLNTTKIYDNKCVYIFKNATLFGNKRIAVQYHDGRIRFGSWDDVVTYNGYPLQEKEEETKYDIPAKINGEECFVSRASIDYIKRNQLKK
jgi:hypothetical protein